MGGLYDPSLEAVVALEPDLVMWVPSAEQRDFRPSFPEGEPFRAWLLSPS